MLRLEVGQISLAVGLLFGMVSPASFGQSKSLAAVAAITTSDVWAVGSSVGIVSSSTLAEHWDGTAWTIMSTPNPPGACSTFNAIAALTSTDVWAVGGMYGLGNCLGRVHPGFIERWNGSSWSIVPSPSPNYRRLTGIAAVATNDIWAVGYNEDSIGVTTTLTEHWDGSKWTVVPSPTLPVQQTYFNAVTAVSTSDVWAVGAYLRNPSNRQAPFVEHWDGTAWKIVAISSPTGPSFLYGAASLGADDVWTTGYSDLAYQWKSSRWSPTLVPFINGANLNSVVLFPGVAWAVGSRPHLVGSFQTLTERWDGVQWSIVDSPNIPNSVDYFAGVSGTKDTDVWAVGGYTVGISVSTLIEHWDGAIWTVVPSP